MNVKDILKKLKAGVRDNTPVTLSPEECEALRLSSRDSSNLIHKMTQKKQHYLKAIDLSVEANRPLRQRIAALEAELADNRNAEATAGREGFIAGAEYLSHLVYAGQATDGYKFVVDEYEQSVKHGVPFEPLLYC